MESLSRRPHRRKQSSANAISSSLSFKNAFEDIFLSNASNQKSFGVNDYAEIFSGPSSIPVLDLSGLDERVGSVETRTSSKLDYSNIFGGLRNDDVAVPYEELFSGAAKKTGRRVPSDVPSPLRELDSLHSSGKTKRASGEVSDQFADGTKKQFNRSFNKTDRRNIDALNGKTHIAEFHAAPSFTYSIDGTPQSQKADDRPVHSLKREVSRTWSFSSPFEDVKGKGGSSGDTSHKSPPTNTSGLERNKNPMQSSECGFVSKPDDSEKNTGIYSPSFLEEELDENSVAALSAAALKKAIEQAEESIRLAKMVMKRDEEGLQNGNKPLSRGWAKVRDPKENRADRERYRLEELSDKEKHVRSDPKFTDKNFAPKSGNGKMHIPVGKVVEERVRENVEVAKDHGTLVTGIFGEIYAPSCNWCEKLNSVAKVEMEKENVRETEVQTEATDLPGLEANRDFRTANFEPVKLEDTNMPIPSTFKITSNLEEMETIKIIMEQKEKIIRQVIESEFVTELEEMGTPQGTQESTKNIDEAPELCQAAAEPVNNAKQVEMIHIALQASPRHCIVDEKSEILSVFRLDECTRKMEIESYGERKHEQKSEEPVEVDVGNLSSARSVFDDLQNGARVLVVKEEQEEVDVIPEIEQGLGKREGGEGNRMRPEEAQAVSCFETEVKMEGTLEEELNEMEPAVISLVREFEDEINDVCGPEIDGTKKKHLHEGDKQNVPGEIDHNGIGERHINASKNEAAETMKKETANFSECQISPVGWVTEGAVRSTENKNKCEHQENMDDVVDSSTDFSENQSQDAGSVFGESQETSDVDLSCNTEQFQISVPEASDTDSAINKDKESKKLFDLEDDEIPETGCLRRSASEETLSQSKFHDVFEGFSTDGMKHKTGAMDPGDGENLSKDKVDVSRSNDDIHDAGKIRDNLYDVETAGIGLTDAREVSNRALENGQDSASSSHVESMDGLSSDESQLGENSDSFNNEGLKDDVKMPSEKWELFEEQSEAAHPKARSGAVYSEVHDELDKSVETGRVAETSSNMGGKENLAGKAMSEEREAKECDKNDRIEAIKRGREREKDRIAVERAIREARERAFAEARERAERAALEKASVEVQQRMMAEAREKLEKASLASKQSADQQSASSVEARLRTERAAVERATAEARERALEKAISQKTWTEARIQADIHPSERVSSSSKNNGLKYSFPSSELEKLDGENTESAQRRKARLERHQRIMERAAKALEEKNMRDLHAQKEQAERNRLAESLDADIKRWATGKERNLRALLSTLQYILGPESGWQPISLTEIITTAAVKKAYRKATLYVHPDKLQQRGASIQQKYICEKVFDLLKAAWNRFNSEER